jgi:hypothetical protein
LRKVEKRESRRKNDDGSGVSLGIYSSARDFGIHAIGLPVAVADLESEGPATVQSTFKLDLRRNTYNYSGDKEWRQPLRRKPGAIPEQNSP